MKKILLPIAVLSMIVLSSCKKDRTCECTYSDGSSVHTSSTVYKKIKKSEAKDICQKETVVTTDSNGSDTYISDCKLK